MKTYLSLGAGVLLTIFLTTACVDRVEANRVGQSPAKKVTDKKTMRAFASDHELVEYLQALVEKQQLRRQELSKQATASAAAAMSSELSVNAGLAAAPAPPPSPSQDKDSVTNVQVAGVDEGGIVKVHGNHLVVLRRGRLFTIAIGGNGLRPISSIDAFAPDVDPRNTWYDEMLVSDDTVAVIGYSYERGGTEVGLFRIDSAGNLTYRATYHLRSNDYYSSRNYASRLIGNKLIFYAPLYFYPGTQDPLSAIPAVRKWHKGAKENEFHRIITADHFFRPEHEISSPYGAALHTVTTCDLSHDDFDCSATSVIGPAGRVFYVSQTAVYVWVNDWVAEGKEWKPESMVYRMPLDGARPTALQASGSPVDQFSFMETDEGQLNVLVRSEGMGDGMWNAERSQGGIALMSVQLSSFSDGSEKVPTGNYLDLPGPVGYDFQNRFVGDYLLYGTGNGWGYPQKKKSSTLYVVRWTDGDLQQLSLTHGTDRIEQLGRDAVVVGTDGNNLHFSAIRLGVNVEVADEYIRKHASQGELRSQGFFYKPNGEDSGMLGLPIGLPARPGFQHLFDSSAAILFLKNNALHFEEAGELNARPEVAKDDKCKASCVDWYGNSRPLFVQGRVIALMGYELVEGSLNRDGQMEEKRRVSYAPENFRASRDREDEVILK